MRLVGKNLGINGTSWISETSTPKADKSYFATKMLFYFSAYQNIQLKHKFENFVIVDTRANAFLNTHLLGLAQISNHRN